MPTTCLKCGHARSASDPPPVTECPKCGAVYAKLEALAAAGRHIRSASPAPLRPRSDGAEPLASLPMSDTAVRADHPTHQQSGWASASFIKRMRNESLYRTFRGLNSIVFGIAVALGLLVVASGVVAIFSGSIAVGFGGVFAGILMIVLFLAAKEVSLMVADLSDAAVRLAEHAERDVSNH